MYNMIQQNGHISYGIKHFVAETAEDINLLPLDAAMGSTVFILSDETTYMRTGNDENPWKLLTKGG